MSATLHLAPVGADKTGLAISLLRQLTDASQDSFPCVWVLLATRRQEMRFRQRLLEADDNPPAFFNIEFFNFYTLNARLLKIAGTPVRRLSPLMRHKILRSLLAQMLAEGQLSVFHRIAETRGFVTVLTELIDELKQNKIDVADFAKAARGAKDKEIAAIYRRYQEALRQSDLADVEGEGWLALATLSKRPAIAANIDMLLVDGYDQFTPVQSQLLAELSRSVKQAHITLTAPPEAAISLAPGRSALARQSLRTAFDAAGLNLELIWADEAFVAVHDALHRLGQSVFRDSPAGSGRGAIKLIEMPDPAEEARAVLRAVKGLLLEGAPANSILIALRDWERYASYFEWGRAEYNLPLLLHYQRSYGSAPVIAAIIDLLELAPRFRRRDLLDVLRSPYFDVDLDSGLIDLLDRLSLERRFLGGGLDDWSALVQLARQHISSGKDDETLTAVTAEQAETLSVALSRFIAAITPPERADVSQYVSMIAALLGSDPVEPPEDDSGAYSLNIIPNAWEHERANRDIVARDIDALKGLKKILRDMLVSEDVLQSMMGASGQITWRQFWSDLKQALQTGADDSINQPRRDQVLVTTAAEARGLPQDHVFILGLAEGVFPAEAAEDPLYLDSERLQLKERGIPLGTRAERIDDRGLFYELISLPRRTLTLSRPTYQAGRLWIESYLWRTVRAVFPDAPIESRPIGAVIEPRAAANSSELMLAVADQLGRQDAEEAELALGARNWLRGQPALAKSWRRIESHRKVEMRRLSNAPFDQYSGILSQSALLDELERRLGDDRLWSASQLNDFGHCPFRFFAKRMLGLSQALEPELGADPAQLGALNHRILEETYRKVRSRQLEIREDNQDRALSILVAAAEEIMPRAPELLKFRETSTWTEESKFLLKRLEALIKLDFSPDSPLNLGETRSVYRQEEFVDEVKIGLGEGIAPLRATALIDRIDNVDGKLVVVDYKTGSRPIPRSEIEIGRDFQMVIYILALMSRFEEFGADEAVAGGLFWHLRNLKTSGALSTDDEDDKDLLEEAKRHIARNLKMARAGQFIVKADVREKGKCSRYCEYSHLCRLRVTGRYKSLPPAAVVEPIK